MLKNYEKLRKLENKFVKNSRKLSFKQAMKIFNSLWNEGKRLGVLPPKDPLEGIETDIRIARILNLCSKKSLSK